MKENSRIRFNPVTKEIEVEGSEEFVKIYFDKLQTMMSGASEIIEKGPGVEKVRPVKKAKSAPKAAKESPPKKANNADKKGPGDYRVTNIDAVVGLIQSSPEGISTAELKEKTGLVERQIWSIVNRAAKAGKITKQKRGLYVAL
jgi:hypothetical protein